MNLCTRKEARKERKKERGMDGWNRSWAFGYLEMKGGRE